MVQNVNLRAFREIPDDIRKWSEWIRDQSVTAISGTVDTSGLANNSVTFAKLQNISTATVLGRATAGSGNVEEISCTVAGRDLLDDASATVQRATLGSTAVGDALFITATAAAARTTLGSTAVGDAVFITASAAAARTTLGSTSTGDALFTAASVTAARTTLGIATGTYTPTLTNTTNLAASTAYQCQYMQVADMVTVSGRVDIDPTLAGSCVLGISLPVASNIGAVEDCAGTAFASGIAGQGAAILGDVASDRATMQWIASDITNQAMYFQFMYQII